MFKEKYFNYRKDCKVNDHSNHAGKYIYVSHSIFDLRYSIPKEFPNVILKRVLINKSDSLPYFELNCDTNISTFFLQRKKSKRT